MNGGLPVGVRPRAGGPAHDIEHDEGAGGVDPRVVEHRPRPAADPGPPLRRGWSRRRPRFEVVDGPLVEVVPEGESGLPIGPELLCGGQRTGIGDHGGAEVAVHQTLEFSHRPHHGIEDGPTPLRHLHPLSQHGAARPPRRHGQIHRGEVGHREVVAEEAGRAGEGTGRPGSPQSQGGHVPTLGTPDLPVIVHHGGEPPAGRAMIPHRVHAGLLLEVTHALDAPANRSG